MCNIQIVIKSCNIYNRNKKICQSDICERYFKATITDFVLHTILQKSD